KGEAAMAFRRLITPAAKFWICKRAITFAAEAMEVLGGNGYVEDFSLARIFRETPVNSIWEGSGNIMCLDVLRVLGRSPSAIAVLMDEVRDTAESEPRLKKHLSDLEKRAQSIDEGQARVLARDIILALQASLLIR